MMEASAVHIQDAGPAHVEALAALHGESFDEGWSAESIAATLASPGAFGFIATQESGGEPLAFALFRVAVFEDGGEAEVLTIATRPQARRRGVAQALMERVSARAHDQGAENIFLEVAADNAPAIGLYRALGFAQTGVRPAYYARPDGARMDARIMRKKLTPFGL